MTPKMRDHLQLAIRWTIALLFLAAATPKIIAPQDFALVVFRYHLLPDNLINLAALVLPWIELVAGITLLMPAPTWQRAAALILVGLLALFTAAIAINLERGLDIDCGCFTLKAGAGHISAWNMGRNFILIVLTIGAVWELRTKKKSDTN